MKTCQLGQTGVRLSQFVLGAMLMGTSLNRKDSFDILDDYFQKGGDFIDTANCYAWWMGEGEYCGDESENIIGQWLAERRNRADVFLATKVGARIRDNSVIRDEKGVPRWGEINIQDHFEGASGQVIRNSLNGCLERLQTDYVDLLYIHVDDRNTDLEETLETMDGLVKEGKVKYTGFSNIQTWRLEKVFNLCRQNNWVPPVAVQLEYSFVSPAKYGYQGFGNHAKGDFFDWLENHNEVSLIAYSPLLKGIYGNDEKAAALLENAEYNSEFTGDRLRRIKKVSQEYGISPNVLVLAWMTSLKQGIFPLLGFSKPEQYYENIKAADTVLDDGILAQLNDD